MIKNVENYLYNSNNDFEIPLLRLDRMAESVITPFCQWGARTYVLHKAKMIHFYTDDYKFSALWKKPESIFKYNLNAVVEPNLSLFDTTPIAYGLCQIFKKRWIARYWQECGLNIYVDLNVSKKFREYNLLGVPQGYNAFATRGYSDRPNELEEEIKIAQRISHKTTPNLVVYGGGNKIREICTKHGLTYIEDARTKAHDDFLRKK